MSSREISIWIDERWHKELSEAMETNLEDHLNGYISQLCQEKIAPDKFQEICAAIEADNTARQAEAEASRRFSILRVVENGEESFFSLERADVLYICTLLRKHLRKEISLLDVLNGQFTCISNELYEQYADERKDDTSERILSQVEIILDNDEVWIDDMFGFKAYRPKDISTAVYRATRDESFPRQKAINSFMVNLIGKELKAERKE